MRKIVSRSLLAAGVLASAGGVAAVGGTSVAGASFVFSSWTVNYHWTGNTGTGTWAFERTDKVSASTWPYPITYTRTGPNITITFKTSPKHGYYCHAIYVGTVNGRKMSGTMSTNGSPNCYLSGTWSAKEAMSGVSKANHATVSASGQR